VHDLHREHFPRLWAMEGPFALFCWRSSEGVIREQIRNALYPVEPMVRDVEAALEAERATHDRSLV
jgi:hypothetical protein